mgnify:FL=1
MFVDVKLFIGFKRYTELPVMGASEEADNALTILPIVYPGLLRALSILAM